MSDEEYFGTVWTDDQGITHLELIHLQSGVAGKRRIGHVFGDKLSLLDPTCTYISPMIDNDMRPYLFGRKLIKTL